MSKSTFFSIGLFLGIMGGAARTRNFLCELCVWVLKNLVKFLFYNKKTTQGNHTNDAIQDSYNAYCSPFSNK